MNKKLSYLIATAMVGALGWFAWLFVVNFQAAEASVKAGLIGLLGVLSAALITHYQTKKREINARHFADKREGYLQIVNLLFEMIAEQKLGKEVPESELMEKILNFKKSLIVWGSPNVIQIWNDYEISSIDQTNPSELFKNMEKILREIRKDLGHDDRSLQFGSLWGLMLKAEDKKLAFGKK